MKIYTRSKGSKIVLHRCPVWNGEERNDAPGIEWIGPTPSAAKVTFEQAYVTTHPDLSDPVRRGSAAKIIILDHNARTLGKRINARYSGTCAVTGHDFEAGTEIYYWNSQCVIA